MDADSVVMHSGVGLWHP